MNLRYGWPLALLAAGCAGGAPLETDSAGTGGATLMMTGSMTSTSSTTVEETTAAETTAAETTVEETSEGSGGSTGTTTGAPEDGGELYPTDVVQSPITPAVAEAMLAIAAKGPQQSDGVFAKVGSSSTASGNFMTCFADPVTIVGLDPGLMDAVTFFNTTMVGMGTSFNRASAAAMADWTALEAITGMPSPVSVELATISPRLAVVLFGTKELEQAQPEALFTFADNLLTVVDQMTTAGTIPILSTLPTRTMPPELAIEVPRYNAVIRAIAQGARVPLVDLNLALAMLPDQGLGADGVDLSVYVDPNMVAMPCNFDPAAGGPFGYNTRNLVTLAALDRARKVVAGEPGTDDAPLLAGAGTLEQPFVIPGLPFSDFRSTADSVSDAIDMYAGGCEVLDESGPEYVYELTVAQKTTIRAMVFDRAGTDVDLHLLTLQDIKTCVRRDDRLLAGPVEAGTYYLAVDTLGAATPGDFALVVLGEG